MPDRAPPPWTVHSNEDAYWVEDATGQRFAFTYYRRSALVGTDRGARLTPELARRLVRTIARLPTLLGRS